MLLLVLAMVLWYFLPREKPPSDPDDLWPEQGEVIAVIEGKEYRYAPNYLYRLTGACFAEDPDKPVTDIVAYTFGWYSDGFFLALPKGRLPFVWN